MKLGNRGEWPVNLSRGQATVVDWLARDAGYRSRWRRRYGSHLSYEVLELEQDSGLRFFGAKCPVVYKHRPRQLLHDDIVDAFQREGTVDFGDRYRGIARDELDAVGFGKTVSPAFDIESAAEWDSRSPIFIAELTDIPSNSHASREASGESRVDGL